MRTKNLFFLNDFNCTWQQFGKQQYNCSTRRSFRQLDIFAAAVSGAVFQNDWSNLPWYIISIDRTNSNPSRRSKGLEMPDSLV